MTALAQALQVALEKANNNKERQMPYETQAAPSSLKATLDQWTKDDPRDASKPSKLFKPTNNVTRETFYSVRDNPNKTNKFHVEALTARGFNRTSIGTLLTQMVQAGMVNKTANDTYVATQQEYTPLKYKAKNPRVKPTPPALKRTYNKTGTYAKPKKDAGIAALNPQPTAPAPVAFNADELLSTLSFAEVLMLYKKIKTMMGET